MAFSLDAADGVIDGKYFGRPIVQASPYAGISQPIAASQFGIPSGYATAYPNVIGQNYGTQFIGASQVGIPQTYASVPTAYPYGAQPAFGVPTANVFAGQTFGQSVPAGYIGSGSPWATQGLVLPQASYQAGFPAQNSALALDAADGVIDGRYFGRPIVGGGAPVASRVIPTAGYGYSSYASPLSYGAPIASPLGYPGYGFGANQSALALDAADGRIDGRYFGRPIAGAAPVMGAYPWASPAVSTIPMSPFGAVPAYSPYSNASSRLALDAADGVIDGRYFGSRIA